jgi:hypothetical protein
MASHLLGDKGLLRASAALVFQLLHVEGHCIGQVVVELPIAYPGIAQQVELGLVGLQVAQVVDGVEIRQACVVQQVLLRDAQLGQQYLGDPVQRLQRGALLALADHLTPAKILGVLPEHCQLRKGVVAHQELAKQGLVRFVQCLRQQAAQTPTLGGQGFADQFLQGGVAGSDDLVLVEPYDQLGGHESGGHVAPHDLRGHGDKLRQKASRP